MQFLLLLTLMGCGKWSPACLLEGRVTSALSAQLVKSLQCQDPKEMLKIVEGVVAKLGVCTRLTELQKAVAEKGPIADYVCPLVADWTVTAGAQALLNSDALKPAKCTADNLQGKAIWALTEGCKQIPF